MYRLVWVTGFRIGPLSKVDHQGTKENSLVTVWFYLADTVVVVFNQFGV